MVKTMVKAETDFEKASKKKEQKKVLFWRYRLVTFSKIALART